MLRMNCQCRLAAYGVMLYCFVAVGQAHGQFSTIINIPPDPNVDQRRTIFSDTQLNLFKGGEIGSGFDAGYAHSTNENIEVNLYGGVVGYSFEAFEGSRVNLFGGSLGDNFKTNRGSMLNISGGEFRLDGVPIEGLESVGSRVAVNLPDDFVLSGTLADGTPFAFSSEDVGFYFSTDAFADETLTLVAAELPPIGPALISLPGDSTPPGIRAGQTVVVAEFGGYLPDNFNAGRGSTVDVGGLGIVGNNFEAVDARVSISTVSIVGNGFDAFGDTVVDITGGRVGSAFEAFAGSTVNVSGGSIAHAFSARSGSTVNISGGAVGSTFSIHDGATVNITGGSVGDRFVALDGGTLNVFGGTIGDDFEARPGSALNLFGSQFFVDGVDITDSLKLNEPYEMNDRGLTFSGRLADGSTFAFNTQFGPGSIFPDARLTVTLVPAWLTGDTDGDGDIDIDDLNNVHNHFGATGPDDGTLPGDTFPFDGRVDIDDLSAVRNHFGGGTAAVPEPAAFFLALLAGLFIAPRRRKFEIRKPRQN